MVVHHSLEVHHNGLRTSSCKRAGLSLTWWRIEEDGAEAGSGWGYSMIGTQDSKWTGLNSYAPAFKDNVNYLKLFIRGRMVHRGIYRKTREGMPGTFCTHRHVTKCEHVRGSYQRRLVRRWASVASHKGLLSSLKCGVGAQSGASTLSI